MKKTILLSFLAISCIAVQNAQADVLTTDGAVVVNSNRVMNGDNYSRPLYRDDGRNKIIIRNGSYNSGGTTIIKDGKLIEPQAGSHDLGNGSKINVDNQGRITNGNVGNVQIRN